MAGEFSLAPGSDTLGTRRATFILESRNLDLRTFLIGPVEVSLAEHCPSLFESQKAQVYTRAIGCSGS